MSVFPLQSYYLITPVKEHLTNKSSLLNDLNLMPEQTRTTDGESIYKQDWTLPESYDKKYLKTFHYMISPYMDKLSSDMYCRSWKIYNTWFQQYIENDMHSWHVHTGANFTNVYFLELPDNSIATELFDPYTKKILKIDSVKEGDLLTFSGCYIHRGPKNTTNKRKTIISFNSSYDDVDYNAINEVINV